MVIVDFKDQNEFLQLFATVCDEQCSQLELESKAIFAKPGFVARRKYGWGRKSPTPDSGSYGKFRQREQW